MAIHSIGNAVFLTMEGPLEPPAQQVELESRSGVDGLAIWRTGLRGEPIDVATSIDIIGDLSTAQNLLAQYRAMQGTIQTVVRADNPLGTFCVIKVQRAGEELLVRAVGGINGGNVLLMARWTLVPVG